VLGIADRGDNIAHFAHLGGMIFGIFMILYWKKRDRDRIKNRTNVEFFR
ncbi:MAG: rhomboid family intramembrane serine protease, partial [Bacteroidales bacterium]|nr:rhomboid family intramembrane serine protease [Bacteroidales bacterium]